MIWQEIPRGESKNIEFKVELPRKHENYIKSIVAFANTSGGKLVVGIDDENHAVIGVNEKEVFRIMDQIANAIMDNCEPQIIPDITFHTIDGKCVVIIEIYPGANRPYFLKGLGKENGTYIRVAGTSRPADAIKMKELEIEGINASWDELICVGYPVKEEAVTNLCADIKRYMLESATSEEAKRSMHNVTEENLLNWKIIRKIENERLATNAFVLLTSNYFRFSKIQCALFKGIKRDIFIDKKEYNGPLYEQIEQAYQFVLRHINLGAKIDGLVRKDMYELPIGAIREMIVNAVSHRNYMDNACVQIAIFDDRVEVTSPGMLYGGLTLEEAMNGRSKIRNKAIAEVFSRMEIIESWGTGIQRILNRTQEYGLPEPRFQEIGDTFRVDLFKREKPIKPEKADKTMPEKPIKPEKADKTMQEKPIKIEKADKTMQKKPIKPEKADKVISKKPINEENETREKRQDSRESMILNHISQFGSISNKEARGVLGLADSTTKRVLKKMADDGKITITGAKKNRRYVIVETKT